MYTYRIVLDAYDSRRNVNGARVAVYMQGVDRAHAFSRLRGPIGIDSAGTAFTSLSNADGWVGTNNMPPGPVVPRSLPEYVTVSVRAVKAAGRNRMLWEYASA